LNRGCKNAVTIENAMKQSNTQTLSAPTGQVVNPVELGGNRRVHSAWPRSGLYQTVMLSICPLI
jgi:hypothetical protein